MGVRDGAVKEGDESSTTRRTMMVFADNLTVGEGVDGKIDVGF